MIKSIKRWFWKQTLRKGNYVFFELTPMRMFPTPDDVIRHHCKIVEKGSYSCLCQLETGDMQNINPDHFKHSITEEEFKKARVKWILKNEK